MTKYTPSAEDRKRVRGKLRKASLRALTQVIYQNALEACARTGAYENGQVFKFVIVSQLVAAADALAKLGEADAKGYQQMSGNCASDDDCPDDYICVEGQCEPLYLES